MAKKMSVKQWRISTTISKEVRQRKTHERNITILDKPEMEKDNSIPNKEGLPKLRILQKRHFTTPAK